MFISLWQCPFRCSTSILSSTLFDHKFQAMDLKSALERTQMANPSAMVVGVVSTLSKDVCKSGIVLPTLGWKVQYLKPPTSCIGQNLPRSILIPLSQKFKTGSSQSCVSLPERIPYISYTSSLIMPNVYPHDVRSERLPSLVCLKISYPKSTQSFSTIFWGPNFQISPLKYPLNHHSTPCG